jgi:hypothetical protein
MGYTKPRADRDYKLIARFPFRTVKASALRRRRRLTGNDRLLLGWRYTALTQQGSNDRTARDILAKGNNS